MSKHKQKTKEDPLTEYAKIQQFMLFAMAQAGEDLIKEKQKIDNIDVFERTQLAERIVITHLINKQGVFLHVDKKLSNELKNAQVFNDIVFNDIKWLAPHLLIKFEDQYYPTIFFTRTLTEYWKLVRICQYSEFNIAFEENNRDYDGLSGIFYQHSKIPGTERVLFGATQIRVSDDKISEYFSNPNFFEGKRKGDYREIYTNNERETEDFVREMLRLIIKILLYISIPENIPQKIENYTQNIKIKTSRRKFRKSSKPKIRPLFHAIYVPTKSEHPGGHTSNENTGKTVTPHRRRGHFRLLDPKKSPRFKERKLVYVDSCLIHGGTTEDVLYLTHTAKDKKHKELKKEIKKYE